MSRDQTKTVLQLKTEIRNQIWASGEPENLVTAHDQHFQEAFAEIAKWVPLCERDDNVDVIRFEKTFFKNGMTVVPAPRGIIQRVYTVANEDYSDPVYIQNRSWPMPEAWARNLYLYPLPDLTRAGKLPVGFFASDPNNDSLYGRSRTGVWSQYQKNLYLAPWLQSNEMLVIEWRGIKTLWGDDDLINPDQNYRKAVKLYVQYCHERDYGSMADAMAFHNPRGKDGAFDEALADLIHECNEQQRVRNDYPMEYERNRLCSEIADDAPITGVTNLVLAHLGNMTQAGENADDVGRLVRGWGPHGILGARFIDDVNTDYDATAGDQFHDFIEPYEGTKGDGSDDGNHFWPAPSQADWNLDSLVKFKGFFTLGGNERYYYVTIGDVQVFVIDSSASEPDGNTSGSTQGLWLQAQLALSTAPWKIVVMDHAPWGSLYNDANLQWPFKTWGADLVISSQALNYERLDISGLPVINNGLGGLDPVEPIGIYATPQTVSSYAAKPGALRIAAKDTNLVAQFWTKDGELIDTLELTK